MYKTLHGSSFNLACVKCVTVLKRSYGIPTRRVPEIVNEYYRLLFIPKLRDGQLLGGFIFGLERSMTPAFVCTEWVEFEQKGRLGC